MPSWKYQNLTLIALIIFAALTILDVTTTIFILEAGGIELNPVMAPIIAFIMPVKAAALVTIAVIAVHCEQTKPGAGPVVFLFAGLIAGAAVSHNYLNLISAGVI